MYRISELYGFIRSKEVCLRYEEMLKIKEVIEEKNMLEKQYPLKDVADELVAKIEFFKKIINEFPYE